jgi:hypothetical protein
MVPVFPCKIFAAVVLCMQTCRRRRVVCKGMSQVSMQDAVCCLQHAYSSDDLCLWEHWGTEEELVCGVVLRMVLLMEKCIGLQE